MEDLIAYLTRNKEWIFSGVGVFAISALVWVIRHAFTRDSEDRGPRTTISSDGVRASPRDTDSQPVVVKQYIDDGKFFAVVEGTLSVDTVTWGATVLLPPFEDPPEITLTRRDGKCSQVPMVTSVTRDAFTITINRSDLRGEWVWRARGRVLRLSEAG
jgi:hypothetical protein